MSRWGTESIANYFSPTIIPSRENVLMFVKIDSVSGSNMDRQRSFAPIIGEGSKVLILGSMPGKRSLEEQQYYAYPGNQFWKLIYWIFEIPMDQDYDKRVQFLKDKGIALWDVIESCYRKGSLDSEIREEKVNDFNGLFEKYSNVKLVAFNGAKAYHTFEKRVGFNFPNIVIKQLPSTSPANVMSFERKTKEWEIIRSFISHGPAEYTQD